MVAASENDVIGKDGHIPWRQQADLDFMRDKTAGCPLIMGRKTHEAIGRPLPGRRNIVVTHQKLEFPGCDVVSSVEEGIELAKKDHPQEVFIFGGGEIYRAAIPFADRMYLTRIHAQVEGDAYFPSPMIDWNNWQEVSRERHEADTGNDYPYTFLIYERKK